MAQVRHQETCSLKRRFEVGTRHRSPRVFAERLELWPSSLRGLAFFGDYDVAVLPQVVRPMALGFKSGERHRTIAIGESESLSSREP